MLDTTRGGQDTSASGNGFGSRPDAINRRGRRASPAQGIRALMLDALAKDRRGVPGAVALSDKLVSMALAGDLEAARLVLLYAYGRPGLMAGSEPACPGGLADAVARLSMSEWSAKMHGK